MSHDVAAYSSLGFPVSDVSFAAEWQRYSRVEQVFPTDPISLMEPRVLADTVKFLLSIPVTSADVERMPSYIGGYQNSQWGVHKRPFFSLLIFVLLFFVTRYRKACSCGPSAWLALWTPSCGCLFLMTPTAWHACLCSTSTLKAAFSRSSLVQYLLFDNSVITDISEIIGSC